jgi:hypothetical protein
MTPEGVPSRSPGQPTPAELPTPDKSLPDTSPKPGEKPAEKLPPPQDNGSSAKPSSAVEGNSLEFSSPDLILPTEGLPQARAANPKSRSWDK